MRAGFVITGTEVLAGRVRDRNGPWLADRLAELGIELAHVLITGDRPADLLSALEFMRAEGVDLIVTSGGLGPTADDLTAQVVADFAGRPLRLDEALERRIAEIIARFARRWKLDPEALQIANRKQAMVPEGAVALDPVGTAPGARRAGRRTGGGGPARARRASCRRAGSRRSRRSRSRAVAAAAPRYRQTMLRLFGIPESEIAETLRVAEDEVGLDGLEITTCLRRGELEVVIRNEPGDRAGRRRARGPDLRAPRRLPVLHRREHDRRPGGAPARGPAARESGSRAPAGCSRRASRSARARRSTSPAAWSPTRTRPSPTCSACRPRLIERHGAVSEEVAVALADGALERFAADTAIGLTGIAGPDGGTPGQAGRARVLLRGVASRGEEDRSEIVRAVDLPGSRAEVRDRATTVALHLLRRLLRGEPVPDLTR